MFPNAGIKCGETRELKWMEEEDLEKEKKKFGEEENREE
jgi:hypothetical protein